MRPSLSLSSPGQSRATFGMDDGDGCLVNVRCAASTKAGMGGTGGGGERAAGLGGGERQRVRLSGRSACCPGASWFLGRLRRDEDGGEGSSGDGSAGKDMMAWIYSDVFKSIPVAVLRILSCPPPVMSAPFPSAAGPLLLDLHPQCPSS